MSCIDTEDPVDIVITLQRSVHQHWRKAVKVSGRNGECWQLLNLQIRPDKKPSHKDESQEYLIIRRKLRHWVSCDWSLKMPFEKGMVCAYSECGNFFSSYSRQPIERSTPLRPNHPSAVLCTSLTSAERTTPMVKVHKHEWQTGGKQGSRFIHGASKSHHQDCYWTPDLQLNPLRYWNTLESVRVNF